MPISDKPIFQQLAEHITAEILNGTYPEETAIPSINEFAAYFKINPATANKGMSLLVAEGVLYKKRGIGMFVAQGAREILLRNGREDFLKDYVYPLVSEAKNLGINEAEIHSTIARAYEHISTDGRDNV